MWDADLAYQSAVQTDLGEHLEVQKGNNRQRC